MCLSVVEIHVQEAKDNPGFFFPMEKGTVPLAPLDVSWILLRSVIHTISEITQLTTNEQPAPGDDQDWDIRIWLKVLCFHPEKPRFRGVNVHPRSTRLQREVAALLEASKCFYLY